MAILGIEQPDVIMIDDNIRLRKYDGIHEFALKWYEDEETVYLVDGKKVPYTPEKLKRMYDYLSKQGELYFIEVMHNDQFLPIGDVTFWQEDMPIVIGDKNFRGKGIGRKVIKTLINRGKELGYNGMYVDEIYDYNIASRKCFERAGFQAYEKTEKGNRYVWELDKQFKSIPESANWIRIEPLLKGWSRDKKYHIFAEDGQEYLLRISDISLYEKKKSQFELLKKIEKMDINASKPAAFGKLNDSEIYMLLTYLEGQSAEDVVESMPNQEAYQLGIEAGQVLKKLHAIEVDLPVETWWDKYQAKIPWKIERIRQCELELPKREMLIEYIEKNMYLVKNQKMAFSHADFHVGNMIVHEGKIGVIDFDKNCIADPYDEFKPFCWNVFKNEYFETGLINGYFDNQIPKDFFPILALYAAESVISHLPWAITFGEEEIATAYRVAENTLKWYDDFRLVIPTWYKGVIDYE